MLKNTMQTSSQQLLLYYNKGPVKGIDNSECPMRCEPPCAKNEMKCPGDRDGNECHESDFCVDRGYDSEGGLCPGYCPFECKIDETQCPGTEQCSTPTCKPKQKDDMGSECPYKNCPVTCKDEAENLCKGVETVDGCLTDDVCVLKKYSDNEVECPAICPVTCDQSTEILCNDQKTVSYTHLRAHETREDIV